MKQIIIAVAVIAGVIGLFFLIMNLIVGVSIYKSDKNHSTNWYNNEFYNEKFNGYITDFSKRDSSTYWLAYKVEFTNQPDVTDNKNYSFELSIKNNDTAFFNQTLINKKIVKDSASKKVKIFFDSIHYNEISIPFSFLKK